ncbi:MAG: hypothetical protein WD557_01635 [Dehalococcoidia bacterium]
MEAVIAGTAAGYAMAIASTLALTYLAWRAQGAPWLERMVAQEVNTALLAVPIFMGASLGWTMIGLVAGSAYRLAGLDDGGWPGTSFYVVVVLAAAFSLMPLLFFWPRYWWMWMAMSAAFVGAFGFLMPALAGR